MAHGNQRKNRIHHGRVDGGQSFAVLQMLQQPILRFLHRAGAERLPGHALEELEEAIERQKEIPPANYAPVPFVGAQAALGVNEQFFHPDSVAGGPTGLEREQDRQRHYDAARPRRHFVQVDVEPVRQQHQFGRDGGSHVPLQRAHQGQVESLKRIDCLEASQFVDAATRALHVWRIRTVASQLEAEVGLYRCINFRGTTNVNIPAAIGQLPPANIGGQFLHTRSVKAAQDVQIQNVIRLERRVRFEFTQPVAPRILQAQ